MFGESFVMGPPYMGPPLGLGQASESCVCSDFGNPERKGGGPRQGCF